MADWNIRPRAVRCAGCGKAFEPNVKGHTLLLMTDEGYARKDLCVACFRQRVQGDEGFTSAAWTFTVPSEAAKRATPDVPVQKETALGLFRKLVVKDADEDAEARYILAILLERGKQFVERGVQVLPEGVSVRLYECRATGELFSVKAPHIRAERLPEVQQRVIDLLEGRESMAPEASPAINVRPLRKRWHTRCGKRRVKRYWRMP